MAFRRSGGIAVLTLDGTGGGEGSVSCLSRSVPIPIGRLACKNFVTNVRAAHSEQKDKAIPLQAWTGPEGSRRLRFPDFKTIGT